eukprot:TRINITY_DN6020_c1_g1_i1.p1 TRINITY_DN6020_c1_g1~~TRINITY_DN6020_c1_g1_i1.p1  ORF type:complete len:571 (-),score=155.82 TRINITY_DN6020_c1_g1_i1:27-1739(-)
MGRKGRKQKDRMFITTKEWQYEWGGAKPEEEKFTLVPFFCCTISFQQMEEPVAAPDGTLFERRNVQQYLVKWGFKNPRTGEELSPDDLFPVKFYRNEAGEFHCPATGKVFTEHTHLVVIRQTGNVFCHEAVNEMNLKVKNLRDLVDDTPFTRKDIITIQDPGCVERRNLWNFHHIKNDQRVSCKADDSDDEGISKTVNASGATLRILEKLKIKDLKKQQEAKDREKLMLEQLLAAEASGAERPAAAIGDKDLEVKPLYTSLAQSQSGQQFVSATLTSSALLPVRKNKKLPLTDEQMRMKIYERLRSGRQRAHCRLQTTLGDLNLELYPFAAPMACENFLQLCKTGYYENTLFHRSIRNFMIQGGDPTGTGSGGESIFGRPFEDEISKQFSHEGKGILSMANSGPNTNGSQFFITYKSCKHLDGKHTIFGKLVGGLETLAKIERVPTDTSDRPKQDIQILKAIVFTDPYDAVREEVLTEVKDPHAQQEAKPENLDSQKRGAWFSDPASAFGTRPTVLGEGIGKYIQGLSGDGEDLLSGTKGKSKVRPRSEPDPAPPPSKAPKVQQWSFDNW